MSTPYSVVTLEETQSTQDDARAAYAGHPVLVVAHRQRAGRGRGGSEWLTAPRAMAASFAVEIDWPPPHFGLIPLVAGLAGAQTLDLDLKWPNDLLADGEKVGGVLVEASGRLVVVGLGLNLWWPSPPAGIGALFGDDPGPGRAEEIGRAWADALVELITAGPKAFPLDEYRVRCVTLGEEIRWDPDGRGRAVGIGPDGGLEVETEDGLVTLRSGEIRHVRPV